MLLLPRRERIEQAQSDLEIDGVISSYQLRRYHGLEPLDLTGRLLTVALIRPVASRPALEVQQTLVVSGAEIAQLGDTELNHKLTLTEMRTMLGVEADAAVWKVDPKPRLKLNQPDGVWISGGQRVAVEADTGQYHRRIVEQNSTRLPSKDTHQPSGGPAQKAGQRTLRRNLVTGTTLIFCIRNGGARDPLVPGRGRRDEVSSTHIWSKEHHGCAHQRLNIHPDVQEGKPPKHLENPPVPPEFNTPPAPS